MSDMAVTYRGKIEDFGDFLEATVGHVGYLIGTRGQLCTQAMIDARLESTAYESYWPRIEQYAAQWIGSIVVDCLGWYEMFENGGSLVNPLSSWTYRDLTTGTMYAIAKEEGVPNGPIATLPLGKTYPIAVGYTGHVGFYHNGVVYQASGHAYGCETTALTDTSHNGGKSWDYWYYLPYMDYSTADTGIPEPIELPENITVPTTHTGLGAVFNTQYRGADMPGLQRKFNDTINLLNRHMPRTTEFIRELLEAESAAEARSVLGIDGGVDTSQGEVIGPASAVSGNFPAFDGTSGKILADSGYDPSDFAAAVHYHAEYVPFSGGTMTGPLVADNNQLYTTKQVRNIILSTEDAVLESMEDGDIWMKYQA